LFRPPFELRAIIERAGISPDREVIVHCQAGIQTTLAFFVLPLIGLERLRAYDTATGRVGQPRRHTSGGGHQLARTA
jgi:3-mercaptopyruvate sulfurtransferase SseA